MTKPNDPKGLKIDRRFTKSGKQVFDQFKFEIRESSIVDPDGGVIFQMDDVEVPVGWSQVASDILAQKYFRRNGVPQADGTTGSENSIKQVVSRMAGAWRSWGERYNYFESSEDANAFEDEISFMILSQYAAPNSPQWFNTGIYEAYGIKGKPQDNWYVDPESGKLRKTKSAFERPQPHACFILSVKDDLLREGGIMDLWHREAKVFKFGSGSGSNYSSIRAVNEPLTNGGHSSGLMSFLKVGDRAAGAVKSGGTTRRAAKMVCLDLDHPEILEFIRWKVEEEEKVAALIKAGYPADYEGEAYQTVSGQNSNNSVRVPDSFFDALLNDDEWELTARTDGKTMKTIRARKLWDEITKAAWRCADPGMQFDSTINDWHTCPTSGRINASNPCSEYLFLDDTACNLASLNLVKFYDDTTGEFDVKAFDHACRLWTIVLEISVLMAQFPNQAVAQNSFDFRTLGIGFSNLGSLLMRSGIAYSSEEGRAIASGITSLMTGVAYRTSAEMAKLLGPFAKFEENRESMLNVIRNHRTAAYNEPEGFINLGIKPLGINSDLCPQNILAEARKSWDEALHLGELHGYRNAQASAIAPTGTIGLIMDCDTTGIEPDFSLMKLKKLSGGGVLKIVNQSVRPALIKLGYTDAQVETILTFAEDKGTVEGAPELKLEHLPVFDCANPAYPNGNRFLSAAAHLKMMAAVQPFISGAISKTVNLPNTATPNDISEAYMLAWKLGLKACSVYRDGCKHSQPLNSASKHEEKIVATEITEEVILKRATEIIQASTTTEFKRKLSGIVERKKLPAKRNGFTQKAKIGGHTVFVRTGEYEDGTLGEVFIDMHREGASFRALLNCFAIAISIGLQYGVPLAEFTDKFTFTRFDPAGPVDHPNIKSATSIVDYMFRLLSFEYLQRNDLVHVTTEKETDATEMKKEVVYAANFMGDAPPCDICGHITIRSGTCYRCLNCGNSLGCS